MNNPPDTEGVVLNDPSAAPAKVSVNTAPTTMDTSTINANNQNPLGPMAESTPPSSQHPDHASPTSLPIFAIPNTHTPPALASVANSQSIECMYIPNCDTGSQMRKAISHIFGRNKMCTRLIPQHIWVHFCRKHYQRSRYRNPTEYAKLQCDLVQTQIRRIHEWSEENLRNGQSGVVQDWSLAIRKREQKRINDSQQKEASKNKNKRKRSDATVEDDDDREDVESPNREPATAVPKWLQEKCHKQPYTTQEVIKIFNKLHREILSDNDTNTFPDLEILPNIIVDDEEPKSPKGYVKRGSASSIHRRSQSLGVVTQTQPSPLSTEPSVHDPPPRKRRGQKNVEHDEHAEHEISHMTQPRMAQPMEGGRRMKYSAHPMSPSMEEHHDYREPQFRNAYYSHPPSSFPAPLPAPAPFRNTGYPLASQLENDGDFRRPTHARSQSDIGSFVPGYGYDYSVFPRSPPHYGPDHIPYFIIGHPPQHHYGYRPPRSQTHMSDIRHYNPAHIRHQSTPIIHPSYSYTSSGPAYHQFPFAYSPLPPRSTPLQGRRRD